MTNDINNKYNQSKTLIQLYKVGGKKNFVY